MNYHYIWDPVNLIYVFMVYAALQVITLAFDPDENIELKYKVLFPVVTTIIIFALLSIEWLVFRR